VAEQISAEPAAIETSPPNRRAASNGVPVDDIMKISSIVVKMADDTF
jgi:hypothetical protein